MSNKLLSSSIGKKLVMSITGIFMILFLLFHASMNLVAVFSAEAYDAICAFLGANWYALAGTAVLAGGFLIHILLSFFITLANQKARGNQHYDKSVRPKEVLWASKNMLVLGFVIVGFICLHLWQFWAKMQLVEIMYGHDWAAHTSINPQGGSFLIQHYFSNPLFAGLYLVWLVALWLHLRHGFWSAFQTIGWNNQTWLPRLQCIGKWVATIICGMFAVVVIVFYIKSLMCGGPTCC